MAIRKRTTKPTTEKTTKKTQTSKEVSGNAFLEEKRLTVSVGTSSEFGKVKVGLSLSKNLKETDDIISIADEIFDKLADKLGDHFDKLADLVDPEDEDLEDEDLEDEDEDLEDEDEDLEDEEDEDEDLEEDEEELTEPMVMKMPKKELLALIKEQEIDIDPKDYPKIKDLREAIIDDLFVPEDEDEDADFDDDEWDDEE